jgi:hypothetical protein
MSKTVEQLAKEYALKTHSGGWEVEASEDGFLAGYKAAQETYEAEIRELKEELKGYYAKSECL